MSFSIGNTTITINKKTNSRRVLIALVSALVITTALWIFFNNPFSKLLWADSVTYSMVDLNDDADSISYTVFGVKNNIQIALALLKNRVTTIHGDEAVFTGSRYLGIMVNTGPGYSITYSNGFLVTDKGEVYKYVIDAEKVMNLVSSVDNKISSIPSISNLYYIASARGAWRAELLTKASSQIANQYDTELIDLGSDAFRLVIYNNSAEDLQYTLSIRLEVSLDGEWYNVPINVNNIGTPMILNILKSGESIVKEYSLKEIKDTYGWDNLPFGSYRIQICSKYYNFEER